MNLFIFILWSSLTISVNSNVEYKHLSWADFHVKASIDNTVSESETEIGYTYDGLSSVKVFCKFNKSGSFVTKNAKTDYILNHEQRHFDITYIFAMKLVKQLKQEKSFTERSVEDIYDKMYAEKEAMQELYDFDTKHSENKQKQSDWNNNIDKMLTNL